ncbi:MAG: AAA family ATPase, partial [Gemmataceae bacterium]
MATPEVMMSEEAAGRALPPPLIRRVRIRGYKSIAFCDVPLDRFTILLGRNGAGKSNFLDALQFISDLMEMRVSEAVKKRGGWRAIQNRSMNNSEIEFGLELTFESQGVEWKGEYQFTLVNDGKSEIQIGSERLTLDDGDPLLGYQLIRGSLQFIGSERFTMNPSKLHENVLPFPCPELFLKSRNGRILLSMYGTQPFVDLAEFFQAARVYNFSPKELRTLRKNLIEYRPDADGSNLPSALDAIQEATPDELTGIKEYLRFIVPEVEDFWKVTYGDFVTIRFRMKSVEGQPGLEFDASSMSDGTLRVLATLVAAFQAPYPHGVPGFVGFEEPETALHPAAMQALADALDEASLRTQVIISTHSAELLSGRDIRPGQVLMVRSHGGQTQITPIDSASKE